MMAEALEAAARRPAPAPPSVWLRRNLFGSWHNTLLTAVMVWLLVAVGGSVLRWALFEANWSVIPANLRLLLVGAYPQAQTWRVWACLYLFAALMGVSAGAWAGWLLRAALGLGAASAAFMLLPFSWPVRGLVLGCVATMAAFLWLGRGRAGWRRILLVAWFFSYPVMMLLVWGLPGSDWLPRVNTTAWGGLLLTMILASVSMAASFPIGILLALGRRSSLPAVSAVCTAYIEVMRGMPLVTIIFMSQVLLPVLLPDVAIDRAVRAMIGLTGFTAAYIAENVRGGLQGVPKGQYEAAEALGLNPSFAMLFVILPQALRAVVPALVGEFISLFRDTSLVAIIGLLDLMGVARSIVAHPNWLGLHAEVYLFAAVVYFVFSYTMSGAGRKVERLLGLGR